MRVTSIFCTGKSAQLKLENDFWHETLGLDPGAGATPRAGRAWETGAAGIPAMPVAGSQPIIGLSAAGGDQWQGSHDHAADRPALSGAGPCYGSRRVAAWLATQRQVVNRKRVRRLMWLMGLWRSIISGRIQPQQQRHPGVYPRMATVWGRLGLRIRPATGLAAPRPNRPQCRRRVLQRATGFIRRESRDLPGG